MSSGCSICTYDLKSPITFDGCHHKCCYNCIVSTIFHKYLPSIDVSTSLTIYCLSCQKGSIELPIEKISSLLKYNFPIYHFFCLDHSTPCGFYCENCSKIICIHCVNLHNENSLKHSIKPLSKGYSIDTHPKKLKLPFKHKTFNEYRESLDSLLNEFEKKVKSNESSVTKKIDKMIKELNEYKKSFISQLDNIIKKEKNIIIIFKQFYNKFYTDIENSIGKKDYIALDNLCNSINRQFSTSDIIGTQLIIEDLDNLSEQFESFLSTMREVEVTHYFPIIPRSFSNSKSLSGHTDKINCITILKNGDIASGGRDKYIRIWSKKKNFECIQTLEPSGAEGNFDWVSHLTTLKDGSLLSGCYNGIMKVWDYKSKFKNSLILTGHTGWVSSALEFDDGIIISSSYDNTLIVRNSSNLSKVIDTLKEHTFGVFALEELPNNSFASAGGDKSIKIWKKDLSMFSVALNLKGHGQTVNCLVYMKERNLLASGSGDKTIKVWDFMSGECVFTVHNAHKGGINSIAVIGDGRIVSGGEDNGIKLWDDENNYNCTHILKGHSNVINALVVIDGNTILSASGDMKIKFWSEERGIFD